MMTEQPTGRVVMVHGAYADGSSWADVIQLLQQAGVSVTSVQNPLTSLADDAAATRRALDLQDGPTVLVGHSWAGTVISEVGEHPNVAGLVYVAARAPDVGEDYAALAGKFPKPPASAGLSFAGGFGQLDEATFLAHFANGVPEERARVLFAVQGPIADTLFASRTTVAAWRTRPCWYAVSKQDHTTTPDLERFVAQPHGRHHHRGRRRPPLDDHPPARDRRPDPRGDPGDGAAAHRVGHLAACVPQAQFDDQPESSSVPNSSGRSQRCRSSRPQHGRRGRDPPRGPCALGEEGDDAVLWQAVAAMPPLKPVPTSGDMMRASRKGAPRALVRERNAVMWTSALTMRPDPLLKPRPFGP